MRFWGPAPVRSGGVRETAVAGRFYSGRAAALAAEVDAHVAAAREAMRSRSERGAAGPPEQAQSLVGVVAPHAGYVYSGPTAGFAYAAIDPDSVNRVVLLGPAHYIAVDGVGLSTAAAWRTPLGDVPLDTELADRLAEMFDVVHAADDAHAPEHSLEVQVPFLQRVLGGEWTLVPLIVGTAEPEDLGPLVTSVAQLPRTLIVVSTDLSHYLDYESAVAQDGRTITSVVHRRAEAIGSSDACGRYPLRGLLAAAAERDWAVRLLDARNSGDTAGDRSRVVGYAAFAVTAGSEPAAATATATAESDQEPRGQTPRIGARSRAALLDLARQTIEDALDSGGRRPDFAVGGWAERDPALVERGAAFVTLRSGSGDLLGCIGALTATQPLVADVAEHAYDAAFRDPRFACLTRARAEGMTIDISVLGPTRPFPCTSYHDLVERLPVGSGIVVEAGRHRATFLPAVWEQLPTSPEFLAALWRKAGLAPGQWPSGIQIELYDSEEFAEP